jgi:hypothetical protein
MVPGEAGREGANPEKTALGKADSLKMLAGNSGADDTARLRCHPRDEKPHRA